MLDKDRVGVDTTEAAKVTLKTALLDLKAKVDALCGTETMKPIWDEVVATEEAPK
jgi:hypothetical protein